MGTLSFILLNPFALLVCDGGRRVSRCESRWLENEGLGVDSGKAKSSGREIVSALRMLGGKKIGGKVMSSCQDVLGFMCMVY